MYCRNCGNIIPEGSKFCNECGTKVAVDASSAAAPAVPAAPEAAVPSVPEVKAEEPVVKAEDAPLFEPFDFKAFGFDFADLGLGTGLKTEETKPTPPTETFDWNTGEFPDRNAATKTEEVNFNWSLSPEEVPAEKIINGIPFYTRIWNTDSSGRVTSEACGMNAAECEAVIRQLYY